MNLRTQVRRFLPLLTAALLSLAGKSLAAPPRPGELAAYEADGTLAKRVAFARENGHDQYDPDLLARARYNMERMVLEEQGKQSELDEMAPPPARRGLPTKGTNKVLCLLVEFNDWTHNPANTQPMINNALFGAGIAANAPYESLQKYYQRSSYNKLTITGNTLGWYKTAYNRSSIAQTTAGRESVIKEVLNYYDTQGHDFTQYDNNGDGKVDLIYVIWAGPDNGWNNFWWAYQTSWSDASYKKDGKSFGRYVWQFQNYDIADPFTPQVIIHETGHALGLPDLYDYNAAEPVGGVGGLDIMDANKGDHNCFSKWLFEWLTPTVLASGSQNWELLASGTHEDCVMIMPGASLAGEFGEFYMAQNRTKEGNDNASNWPGAGMMIWHVDSRLLGDGTNFAWNNNSTAHKFMRLMEADGLEEISGDNAGDAGDYYALGKSFTPTSSPNSHRYDGSDSKVAITNFTAAKPAMRAQFTIIGAGSPPTAGIYAPGNGTSFAQGVTIPITALVADNGVVTGVAFYVDGELISWDYTSPFTASLTGAAVGARKLSIVAVDDTLLTTTSDIVTVNVTALSPPVNDNFAARTAIAGNVATVAGTNVSSSAQASEPAHAGHPAEKSVWWTWTPSITGTATITTTGSNFDTLLAAYTGSELASLSLAAQNDDSGGTHTSSMVFGVTAGVPVQIAVDGYTGAIGTVTLNVSVVFNPPSNDHFASATTISNASIQTSLVGTNNGATAQAGEPPHGGAGAFYGPFASAWWKWTAPSTGSLDVSTSGSAFDTTLGVYTGASVNALTLRASNDDTVGVTSAVTLPVTGGVTYYIAVDGYNGATGLITLQTYFSDVDDPPSIYMSRPYDGESIGLNTWMQVATEAYDPEGHIKEVRFYLNGILVDTVASQPESVSFDSSQLMSVPGYYTVTATAEDTGGLTASTSVTVLVSAITLPEALDNFGQLWLSGGPQSWSGTAASSHDASDSAVSGVITHSQQSWFRTNVVGPGNVSFWWSVSSELNFDYLTFFIDGVAQPGKISGIVPWAQVSINVPFGNHTLKWEYSKDISVSANADAGWVDQVVWLTPPVLSGAAAVTGPAGIPLSYAITADTSVSTYSVSVGTLPPGMTLNPATGIISGTPTSAGSYPVTIQATNAAGSGTLAVTFTITPSFPIPVSVESPRAWPTGGNAIWYGQPAISHDGVDAAQSAPMVDAQSSWTQSFITGPGTLSFWCKISSEANYDYLRFTLDSVEQPGAPAISGAVDWVQRTVAISEGNHVIRWTYAKDFSVSSGSDAAWIDQVVFAPTLPVALDTPALAWGTFGNVNWDGQILVTHDGVDAAQSGDINDSQTSSTQLTVGGAGTLSFWWKVSSEANFDFLRFYLDNVEQPGIVAISGEVDWVQRTIAIPAGIHTLRWTYSKDGSQSTGSDAAWLDQVVWSSFTFTAPGTTVGRSLWNRPGQGAPPIAPLSGTAVPYDVMCFTVSTTGSYTLKTTSVSPALWDNYMHLYSTAFNPAAPLTNVIAGNDDFGSVGVSSLNVSLTAGTRYYLVTSGFSNSSSGSYTIDITGAGSVEVTLTVPGTTAGRPLWHRPELNGNDLPVNPGTLGTAVPYDVVCFTVSATANYVMKSTGTTPSSWDNYLVLYADSFDPAAPLSHVLVASDDFPGVGVSGFTAALSAGRTYFLVTTGFQNYHSGACSVDITGPGRPQAATAVDNWRLTWFGSKANSGNGADGNDFDRDGILNFDEFAYGLNPTSSSVGQVPAWQQIAGNSVLSFTQPAGVTGITYHAAWSTTLQPGSWVAIPDTGIAPQHTFTIPAAAGPRRFLQFTATAP